MNSNSLNSSNNNNNNKNNSNSNNNTKSVQDMVQNSINRLYPRNNSKKNSAATTGNNNSNETIRRESTLPPSSSSGNVAPSTYRLYPNSNRPQDPRPLRSHRYQTKIQEELYQYLSTNKFDIEMKQILSLKTLKTPTQKEFLLIFQWLYKQLDPGYKFNRSIEQDIYTLLKFLEYPFLDTINKSQISAVGGTNWPIFLGMLHWLLNLVKETVGLDDLDLNGFQDLQSNKFQTQLQDDSVIYNEQSIINKLFITYALKSYKSFLSFGEDDYSEFYNEMQNDYQNYLDEIQRKTHLNSELNETLQETFQSCKQKYNLFYDELERTNALKTDVTKFQNYIDLQRQRQIKWPNIIEKARNDIQNINESIQNINKEKQDIISDLEKKNLTLKDIENLHIERSNLTSSLNLIDSKQSQIKDSINSKLVTLKSSYTDLKNKINLYNESVYQILNETSLTSLPAPSKLVINSLDDEFQSSKFGLSSEEIIPNLPTLRTSINEMNLIIQSEIGRLQDDILQSGEKLDDIKLSNVSYSDKFEELEESLSKSKKEYNDLNEKYTTDSSTKQFELEQRAKEIRMFKLQNVEIMKSTETKWQETQKQYKKTISTINEKRAQLVCDIAKCLNDVVSFKGDIMTDLENIVMEINHEIKEQIK